MASRSILSVSSDSKPSKAPNMDAMPQPCAFMLSVGPSSAPCGGAWRHRCMLLHFEALLLGTTAELDVLLHNLSVFAGLLSMCSGVH